jgi:hypothetical protein
MAGRTPWGQVVPHVRVDTTEVARSTRPMSLRDVLMRKVEKAGWVKVAAATGLDPRRLRSEARREGPLSAELTHVLGAHFNFDPVYLAKQRAVDELDHCIARREGATSDSADPLQRHRDRIRKSLTWDNPYDAGGYGRRLAFQWQRLSLGVGIAELAAAPDYAGTRARGRSLLAYEYSRAREDMGEVKDWLAALSDLSGQTFSLDDLNDLAERLLRAHHVRLDRPGLRGTVAWRSIVGEQKRRGVHIFGPPPKDERYALRWGATPTAFGAIDVEFIEARLPREVQRSRLRIVAAPSPGFELAFVMAGRVKATIRKRAFAREEPRRTPRFKQDEDGVIYDDLCAAGDGLFFDSGHAHRVEFLAPYNLVVAVNLRGNVDLARRLHPKPARTTGA